MREWCLAFHDVRACAVEVVSWWDELQHSASLPDYEQQALALEVLQVGAPLGHALGLGPVAALMEDLCLKVSTQDGGGEGGGACGRGVGLPFGCGQMAAPGPGC